MGAFWEEAFSNSVEEVTRLGKKQACLGTVAVCDP